MFKGRETNVRETSQNAIGKSRLEGKVSVTGGKQEEKISQTRIKGMDR